MKIGHPTLRIAALVAVVGSGLAFWSLARDSCSAKSPRQAGAQNAVPARISSGFKIPGQPGSGCPMSVSLSPDSTKLAVVSGNHLLVRDLRSNKWVRDFGEAYSAAARWHPSEPVITAAYGSARQPGYYLAYLASGKRRQVFRGDALPVAWTTVGLLAQPAGNSETVLAILDLKTARVTKSGNFGHKIPWNMFPKAIARYLSPAGPDDQVAAELQPMGEGLGLPPRWIAMYRRVPGRIQWVRTGVIRPGVNGGKMVWYPRNPNWLYSGRLAYLRVYPAQWVSFYGSGSQLNPKAWNARNRAELWTCTSTGADQRKIVTIWDLRPYVENPSADWMAVDRQGRNLYYLSGKHIRHADVAKKINK